MPTWVIMPFLMNTERFRLTGKMCESGQFPRKLRPAATTVQQLRESTVWAKKMVYASCKRVASDPEIAESVCQETLQRLGQGPFFDAEWISAMEGAGKGLE